MEKLTNRFVRFGVNVTPEEKAFLQSAGNKAGRPKLADFVRQAALERARTIHEDHPDQQN